MSVETLQSQLEDIQTATNNIKTALEEKGETPTGGIQTFAASVSNLGNINTVNGIGADENRNAQLDASKINVDDTAETKETIKSALENKQETLISGTNIKTLNGMDILGNGNLTVDNDYIFLWNGNSSTAKPEMVEFWQNIVNKSLEKDVIIIAVMGDDSNYSTTTFSIPKNKITSSTTTITLKGSVSRVSMNTSSSSGCSITGYQAQVTLRLNNLVITSTGGISGSGSGSYKYLPTEGTVVKDYVPTNDYHPTTKIYVDEYFQDPKSIPATEAHTGTYYFAYDSTTESYKSNNQNQSSSTAESTLTFSKAYTSDDIVVKWEVASESNYDKLTIKVGDTTMVNGVSGSQSGSFSCDIPEGTTMTLTYSKDSGGDSYTDTATVKIVTKKGRDYLSISENPSVPYEPKYDGSPATKKYVDTKISSELSSIQVPKSIDGTVFGGWHMYSDGENLTEDAGFTSADWDNIVVGNILSYQSSTDSSASVNTGITYVSTGYAYKSAGGRYYYRTFSTGSGSSYEISGDLFGTGNIFKGLTIDEGSSGGGGGMACFTANTKVATENGYKSISEIKVGDLVYSYNYKTKEVELKEVDKLVTHDTDEIYNIKVNDEIIETTWSHPFFVVNEKVARGRIQARCLVVGDILLGKDGKLFKVDKVEPTNRSEKVYEIRVKDNNCYFVGDTSILVYNEESVLKDE